MKTVIIAGGKGTRISELYPDIPKPMIPIDDKPVLEHEIICLRDQGLTDIIITVNHLKEKIINYFGDGSKLGVSIEYFEEDKPIGNAGALRYLKDKLTDDFILVNADSLFNIDFNRFVSFHNANQGIATILTHPNNHPYDSGLIFTDSNHVVTKWLTKEDEKPEWYKNRVNAGVHIFTPKIFDYIPDKDKVDLDRDILKPLINTGKLVAYDSTEYVKDMGTPERLDQVRADYLKGIVYSKSLRNKQKAVFLDRDGTINRYVGFLRNIDDFELLPGVAEAIRQINESGYLAIVVTNQPVIARGEVTFEELEMIHNKMETLLGDKGAYLDAIYFCPHHPDKGYDGEVAELKIQCDCRKPKPGMLLQAAEDYNIDLTQSYMIGDSDNDIIAGESVGCMTKQIKTDESFYDYLNLLNPAH